MKYGRLFLLQEIGVMPIHSAELARVIMILDDSPSISVLILAISSGSAIITCYLCG